MPLPRNVRRAARRLKLIAERFTRIVYDPYPAWLEQRIAKRAAGVQHQPARGQFSLLTCVYQGTPAELFRQTVHNVFDQTAREFEWVVLAQGPVEDGVERLLAGISADPPVRVLRSPINQGVIRGLCQCLQAATGDYVIPLDSDDLLCPDALCVLAKGVHELRAPEFIYTDEDILAGQQPKSPFHRPDWDPILNLSSSYIWHISMFRRTTALKLGVYSDVASNWCQDWDTVFRFADAGIVPVHIPEVLHHWRRHRRSSTNRNQPDSGSLDSQKHILELQLARRTDQRLFRVQPFPLFRGSFEWCIERRRIEPEAISLVCRPQPGDGAEQTVRYLQELLWSARYPFQSIHILGMSELPSADRAALLRCLEDCKIEFGLRRTGSPLLRCWPSNEPATLSQVSGEIHEGITVVCSTAAVPRGERWPWEVQKLFALHADAALIAGRLVDDCGLVRGGGESFSESGPTVCPEVGVLDDEPGAYALLLKERSVDAVNSAFFAIRTGTLQSALRDGGDGVSPDFLGTWLGAYAAEQQQRVAATPLVAARVSRDFGANVPDLDQWAALHNRFPGLKHRKTQTAAPAEQRRPRAA